jgi:hypothetical protein
MKVALCLYGQPRNFTQNWDFIQNNIISPNNADVFFHTWYDENNTSFNKMTPGHESRSAESNLQFNIPEITKAKDFIIEKQIEFHRKEVYCSDENFVSCWPWAEVYNRDIFLKDRVFSHYSMWYSINQSLLLKELYSQREGFVYDCVMILRFDVSPKKSVDINSFDLNNITSGYPSLPRGEINDWFIISNNINSNIISSTFYSIDYHRDNIIKQGGIWTNEAYLRDQIKMYNLSVDYQDLNVTF